MAFTDFSIRDMAKVGLPALILIIIGFVLAYQFVGPPPPKTIRIATGQNGGAYHTFAHRYAEYLQKEGITLDIVETDGSVENLRLLNETASGIDLGLIQSGVADELSSPNLSCLASLYYEPLWVFHQKDLTVTKLGDLKGKRISTGKEESGSRALAKVLLKENGVTTDNTEYLTMADDEAVDKLFNGDIDAVFLVTSPNTETVTKLSTSDKVTLFSVARAQAYTRRFRFLSSAQLPQGVLGFEQNIPERDIMLICPAATMIARNGLHPALTDLLLQAANKVHGKADLFSEPGTFPSPKYCDLPLSPDAKRYYKYGPPFLQRYLPFWLATLLDRLKIMLLPLVFLLLPMFKLVPPIFQWSIRRKVIKWYKRLQEIDLQAEQTNNASLLEELIQELAQIELDVSQVNIPLGFADQLYNLRLHVELVQARMREMAEILESERVDGK